MAPSKKMVGSSSRLVTKAAVKQMISSRQELKRIVPVSSGGITAAGSISYMSTIAQGDDLAGRTGDRIQPKSLDWIWSVSDTVATTFRMLIFQDSSASGSAPSISDVLSSATPQAHLNPFNAASNRFKVLVDQVMDTNTGNQLLITKRGRVPLRMPIHFTGTGSTSASCGKGALFLLVIVSAGVTNASVVNAQLTYTDS